MAGRFLFTTKPGVTAAMSIANTDTVPGTIVLNPTQPIGALISSIGIQQGVNIQFSPSLEKIIYVYAFGDKMGSVEISGRLLDSLCQNQAIGAVGPVNMLKYDSANRAVQESRQVKVGIGNNMLEGFLIAVKMDTANVELRTMSFSLTIATVPMDNAAPAAANAARAAGANSVAAAATGTALSNFGFGAAAQPSIGWGRWSGTDVVHPPSLADAIMSGNVTAIMGPAI